MSAILLWILEGKPYTFPRFQGETPELDRPDPLRT